jgi:hypothetical protein
MLGIVGRAVRHRSAKGLTMRDNLIVKIEATVDPSAANRA